MYNGSSPAGWCLLASCTDITSLRVSQGLSVMGPSREVGTQSGEHNYLADQEILLCGLFLLMLCIPLFNFVSMFSYSLSLIHI